MNPHFTVHPFEKFSVVEFRTPSLMDPIILEEIGKELYRLVDAEDRRKLVLDFERVQYLSSQAIGIILTLNKKLAPLKYSKLVLCGVGPKLMELLKITRLDRILTIKPTQQDAVKVFESIQFAKSEIRSSKSETSENDSISNLGHWDFVPRGMLQIDSTSEANMSDVHPVPQFSVFLVNKPGVLAQVTSALASEKVNLIAVTLVDSQEHGVLRIVAEKPDDARRVLTKLNLPLTETEVLCVDLPNRPGALADVATLLGKNHININYAYVTSGAPGGRTTGVFKVGDQSKAMQVLKKSGAKHKEPDLHRGSARR